MNRIIYRLLLLKAYFDKGFSLMNYLKYPLFLLGLGEVMNNYSPLSIICFSLSFGLFCFIFGWLWFHLHFVDIETEIQNMFNPFCKDVRDKFTIATKL